MTTNIRYRGPDGFTVLGGGTEDFGQIVSDPLVEVDKPSPAIKICCENISDRELGVSPFSALVLKRAQVASNDGVGFVYSALDTSGTLSKPFGDDVIDGIPTGAPALTLVADPYAAWVVGSYGIVVTAVNATGETIASIEKVFTVVSGDASMGRQYAWEVVTGATNYHVYRTTTPGTYGAYSLVGSTGSGGTVSFVDHGSAPTVGTPPSANTTGGAGPAYGTPPSLVSFTAADKTLRTAGAGGLEVGEQAFFWIISKIPAGTLSIGNKRIMQFIPTEVI